MPLISPKLLNLLLFFFTKAGRAFDGGAGLGVPALLTARLGVPALPPGGLSEP